MDGARDDLLARARLAHDEDARVRGRHELDPPVEVAHDLGAADDRTEAPQVLEARPQVAHLARPLARLLRALERDLELARVDRLPQVVARAGADRLDRRLDGRVTGEDEDLGRHGALARRAEDVDPVAVPELEVGHDDVVGRPSELAPRRLGALGAVHVEAPVLEERGDRLERVGVVVHGERPLPVGPGHGRGLPHRVALGRRARGGGRRHARRPGRRSADVDRRPRGRERRLGLRGRWCRRRGDGRRHRLGRVRVLGAFRPLHSRGPLSFRPVAEQPRDRTTSSRRRPGVAARARPDLERCRPRRFPSVARPVRKRDERPTVSNWLLPLARACAERGVRMGPEQLGARAWTRRTQPISGHGSSRCCARSSVRASSRRWPRTGSSPCSRRSARRRAPST